MDAPPADLFRHNPVAFQLWAELAEHPRPHITRAEAAKLLGAGPVAVSRALNELLQRGALVRVGAGKYGEPARQVVPVHERSLKPCLRCGRPIGAGRKKFCSDVCAVAWHNAARTLRDRQDRQDRYARCAICGKVFPRRAHAKVDLYCSPACARGAERQQELARDIAAGTARTCETCGRQMPAKRVRWCSGSCRALA